MKKFSKFLFGLVAVIGVGGPVAFADNTLPTELSAMTSKELEVQMVQLLTQMESQLQTVANQQSQMQQTFQGYVQFQFQNNYPIVPFPGWKDSHVSALNPSGVIQARSSSGELFRYIPNNFGTSPQEVSKKQILQTMRNIQNSPVPDSAVPRELDHYASIVNNVSDPMNATQSSRLISQLLVLNTKAVYLQYQEEHRLEQLLTAQLLIQSQEKNTGGNEKTYKVVWKNI